MSDSPAGARSSVRIFLTIGTSVLFISLMLQPAVVSEAVSSGMTFFAGQLVPVLFPYMVLSHFICTYGLLDPFAELLPVGKLFRMDACACGVFLMGHLCGYPVGAKMAAESVRQGKLTERQGEILCAVSSGASPAFLVHAVGGGLFGDIRFGAVLLTVQVLYGLVLGTILGRKERESPPAEVPFRESVPFARCFCDAVSSSAQQLVYIGGYIVFFTLLTALFPLGGAGAAVLEFSTGVRLAARCGGMRGLFLAGFTVGFGGLSVLMQTAHMLSGTGISLKTYTLAKILSGFILGLTALGYGFFTGISVPAQDTAAAVSGLYIHPGWFAGILGMMWYFSVRHGGTEQ